MVISVKSEPFFFSEKLIYGFLCKRCKLASILRKMRFSTIDIFCHVVDNFGDIGFVYRFAKEFSRRHPSCRIRVFCDDLTPLFLMAPGADEHKPVQQFEGIAYIASGRLDAALVSQLGPADAVIEAFGCEIPPLYQRELLPRSAVWVNLEHLSAEQWVDGYHLQRSLHAAGGPAKFFFMPGFTEKTGGVLIDSQVEQARPNLTKNRLDYLNNVLENFKMRCPDTEQSLFGTVFTYVRGFDTLLADLQNVEKEVYLFVLGDKSRLGMLETMKRAAATLEDDNHYAKDRVHVLLMPFLAQDRFDSLLCVTDFNLVRGEDSLVRAILAGKPFIWNAYLQKEKYHSVKIEAFLNVFRKFFEDQTVFNQYRELMMRFNDAAQESPVQTTDEHYEAFFRNFIKIEHATKEMSYFMTRKCSLIDKFTDFLSVI
jgi:uncharacterized repeat protein (TIGR03837 family)